VKPDSLCLILLGLVAQMLVLFLLVIVIRLNGIMTMVTKYVRIVELGVQNACGLAYLEEPGAQTALINLKMPIIMDYVHLMLAL